MAVNRHITGTANQGGNFTAGKIPTTTLFFLFFFFARYLFFFCGYLGLKGSHISSEKKQK